MAPRLFGGPVAKPDYDTAILVYATSIRNNSPNAISASGKTMEEPPMPHPVDVQVGQRIRELRQSRHMTQQQLAEKLGVSFQQVQKYELGRNRISASRLWEVAKVLNVSPGFMFEGVDEKQESDERIPAAVVRSAAMLEKVQDDSVKMALASLIKACAVSGAVQH